MMTIADLGVKLPDETITWSGFGQPVLLNFTALTGELLTPESSALEPVAKLLNGLFQQQAEVNATRALSGLPAISVVMRSVDTNASGNPIINLGIALELDLNSSLDNLIDPTA